MAFYYDSFGFYKISNNGGASTPSKNIYVANWDTIFSYNLDTIVAYQGQFYKSLSNSNQGNNPSTDIINWELFSSGSSIPSFKDNFIVADWISDGIGGFYIDYPASEHLQSTDKFIQAFFSKSNTAPGENTPYGHGDFIQYDNGDVRILSDEAIDGFVMITAFIGGSQSENIPNWISGGNYIVDDSVIYNYILYRCINANTDLVFNPTNWQVIGTSGVTIQKIQDTHASLNPGESFVVDHTLYPDLDNKRIVQVMEQAIDSNILQTNESNSSLFTQADPTKTEFTSTGWQLAKDYYTPTMVANYLFNNNEAYDYTNKGNDGVLTNCDFGIGIVENSLVLDGTAYMDIPYNSDIDPAPNPTVTDWSLEFWIKTTSDTGEIINLWNEDDDRRSWRVYLEGGIIHIGLSTDGINMDSYAYSGFIISNDTWTHVGIYWDNLYGEGKYLKIFINGSAGIPGFNGGFDYPLFSNTIDNIRIGATAGSSPSNYFIGQLAEFAIYRDDSNFDFYQFSNDYYTNQNGDHLGQYNTDLQTMKTNVSGQIDTSSWTGINRIYFYGENFAGNTYILVSVDGGITFKSFDGISWNTVLETDVGMTNEELNNITPSNWSDLFVVGTLDYVVQVITMDSYMTPNIQYIAADYQIDALQNSSPNILKITFISPTETRISNISNSNGIISNIVTNILI